MHNNTVYLRIDKLCKRDCGVHLCQQVTALLFFPLLVLYKLDQKLHINPVYSPATPKPKLQKTLLHATSLSGIQS